MVIGFAFVFQIPNMTAALAKECAIVSVINGEASESIFCKGVVEKSNESFIVKVQISEEDIGKISVGMPANITCKALGDKVLLGRVDEIFDYAYKISYGDAHITVIDAIIGFDEAYSASVDIVYTKLSNAVILPYECIATEKNGKNYIYRINKDWAVKEYVEVAFEDEKGAVLSGKCDFDTICEQPESFLGDYVRIKNVGVN